MRGKETVPPEEVVLPQVFEFSVLLTVLARRGLFTRGEWRPEVQEPRLFERNWGQESTDPKGCVPLLCGREAF